ncbi:FHA domain-containing protein FHA2-like [Rutidosis leptorrhynchoides]|uniref:FHA domain-containing protein FHA2-like n=1 Tax=Rutidosis leptorrhynchoides TaxID=125765 RepID=UPI003A9A5CDA
MASSDVEAGFAKLQGEDFEYYMQTYSIILGRNSKKSTVDVDLSSLGGGMNISRHHARIFYDFQRRRFALEVLGKNGCSVEGVLHLPGTPPVKLDSQDLLQIGDKEFYFLLPVRSILSSGGAGGAIGPPRQHVSVSNPNNNSNNAVSGYQNVAGGGGRVLFGGKKGGRGRVSEEFDDAYEDDDVDDGGVGKKMRIGGGDGLDSYAYGVTGAAASGSGGRSLSDRKSEGRSRIDRESDNQQLLQLEEKDVISSVATVLSDLCGPSEWMAMEKLHTELVEQYGDIWHHSRVRRYLTSEDYPSPEAKGKPWFGLLMLLRKYPEHFVINTRSKGRVTQEFVSLVSLIS